MADSPKPQTAGDSTIRELLKEPIGALQSTIIGIHDALEIPWWATIVGAGVCARALTLPLSLRAAAAGTNFTRARTAVHTSTFRLLGDAGFATCTPELVPHSKRVPAVTQQLAIRPSSRMWMLAPVAQVPFLAVGTLSLISLEHPALATEGCLWFPDLLKTAFSIEGASEALSTREAFMTNEEFQALRGASAPMGLYGTILPTAFYLLWQDNLSNTMRTLSTFYFRTFAKSTFESGVLKGASRAQSAINTNVRFSKLVSLLIYPILYTVPTGGLLYLTTSSASAWLTFRLLPFLQHTLYGQPGTSIATTATPIKHAEHASNVSTASSTPPRQENATLASSLMSSGSNGHHGSDSATVTVSESSLAELQSCTDVEKLLEHSILHHAKKHTRVALFAAQRALELEPKHARIAFAVAQLHRDLQQWKSATQQLNNCLLLEPAGNTAHRARVLSNKSKCLLELRRPSEALEAATAAVQLQPDEPMHWIAKMNVLRSSGNISAAIQDAMHIATLDPDLGKDLPSVLAKLHKSRNTTSVKRRASG